jgi:hypothetical protein
MSNIKKFNSFINEATMKGNTGFPGEDPNKPNDSFLNAILSDNQTEAQRLQREHGPDIFDIMGNVNKAERIQSGKENELSLLAEDIIREVYGTFIDDVILDLKITKRPQEELKKKMEVECPECQKKAALDDPKIIDEINKRKIFRTIQQGKGLNVKQIINLPSVAKRLKDILGEANGNEYRILANKIAAGAHFFDLTLSLEQKKQMFRQAPPGACDISITEYKPEEKKDNEEETKNILDDILNDKEVSEESAEIALEGVQSTVIARATDFGLLLHESVKGIYKLITQALLIKTGELLGDEAAGLVKSNTETLFDEVEEQAIGKTLQMILGIIINSNNKVEDIIYGINSGDDYDDQASQTSFFLEQLHFLVYGKLSQLTPAKVCLELFHSILEQVIDPTTRGLKTKKEIENIRDRSMIDPIINQCLSDMDAEKEYQDYMAKYGNKSSITPKSPNDNKLGFKGLDDFNLN